jgi:hypothetical protein
MATLEEIGRALKNAHDAGDTASAQKLAAAYQREKAKAAQPAAAGKGGMMTEGTISREEYMRQRGLVNEAYDAIPQPDRINDTLKAPGFAFGTVGMMGGGERTYPASGSLGKETVKPDFQAPLNLDQPITVGVPEKMTRPQSFGLGVTDVAMALPGAKSASAAIANNLEGGNRVTAAQLSQDIETALTQSLQDNPVSTRLGQTAAYTAGGGAQLTAKALTTVPKLVAPAVGARFAGQSLGSQAVRYGGRGALLAGTGAADYYAYNALAEAPNQFREQGLGTPTVGDRIDYANSQVFTPGGAIAAGLGPLASMVYRPVRAAVAGGKNLVTTGTARPAVTAGRPTLPAAGGQPTQAPLTNLFTPSDVQKRVAGPSITPTTKTRTGRTAREEAIDLVLAKGFQPDEAEKLVKLISYDNYASVDEMLFELASADVDQLTVAVGRIGGDAKKTLREAFKARNANMPDQIRVALRDAMGLSGDDLEDFAKQMATRADEATSEGYAAAYATQVSDDTWAKIWDRFRASPDAAAAAAAGSRLAKNSYRGNPAQLEVARQLDELAGALRSPLYTPPKLSTHALDYLDRGFGSLIAGEKKNNKAFAASLIEIQKAIRNAGLDADTGLSGPREVYSQYMAASRALDYGAKAFGRGTPLRDIKKQFAATLKDADEVFEDIAGEGQSIIDQSLIMGWLRGAEDAVETATNPGALIRQIYGSERQRAKLLEMMPKVSDKAAAGVKGDQTKRIRALVGGKRSDNKGVVESIFERQRRMLESQGRISGNSQTADAQEAIFAQGGRQRLVNTLVGALMNPQDAAKNAALWAVERVTTPAIFKPAVNKELGDILATRGRDELLAVIAEIRARQLATGKGPKPAAPPPASGGTASTAQKPGKTGTRIADGAAIATLGLQGGTAEADTGGVSAELKTANEQVATATKRVADVDAKITRLQDELDLLERAYAQDPTVDAKRVQLILEARDFDLGPKGADGRIGPDTRIAIKGNIAKIEGEIAKQQTERSKAEEAEATALQTAKNAERQAKLNAMQAKNEPNMVLDIASKVAMLAGLAGGVYWAKRGRGGAVAKSAPAAKAAAARANALLNSKKLTTAKSGPNSLNQRAANINEFWKQGGAGRKVPFQVDASGNWTDKPGAMEPAQLFNPKWYQQYRNDDVLYMVTAAVDVGGSRAGINYLNDEIKKVETEYNTYEAKDDFASMERKQGEKTRLEGLRTMLQITEKVGGGYLLGRAVGSPLMPYAKVNANVKAAEAQRASLLQKMNPPQKPNPAGNNQGQGNP